MRLKLFTAVCCLLALCSCSPITIQNTESLLDAPKLNKRQSDVSQALEASLSLRVIYRYPQGGEYRSPFVFYDLDGDGVQEAIVFYSYTGEPDSKVRAKILTQGVDGEWTPFYDVRSQSSQVEFVQFEKLLDESPSPTCMIVGWSGTGRQPSTLEIYSMTADHGFKPEATIEYYHHAIRDFDGDGLSEIVVIGQEGSRGRYSVDLVTGLGGHIETTDSLTLSSEAESALTLTTGKLWDGGSAVYIDESLIGGPVTTIATEIIRVSSNGLTMLCGDDFQGGGEESFVRSNYELTFRDDNIYCMDFDGDGVVEVPYPVALPGAYESGDMDMPKLIHFMQLTQTGFDVRKTGVINSGSGYLLFFPNRWRDKVVVEREQENSEWRFRKWNADTLEPAEELLRIRVSPTKDYLDMFAETENYIELYARGTTSYTAYVPRLQNETLAVTEQEVESMFSMIPA